MNNALFFLWSFFLIFLINLIFRFIIYKRKKVKKMAEYILLVQTFKTNVDKLSEKQLVFIISICNSLVLANSIMILSSLKVSQLLMPVLIFAVIIVLMVVVYYTVSLILGKK